MDLTNKISNFLNEDSCYLLGLIIGRGTIIKSTGNNRIIIGFPYKNLLAKSPIDPNKKIDTQLYLSNSVDKIVNRIKSLGFDVTKISDDDNKEVSLFIDWQKTDLTWQLINYLLNDDYTDYHSFRVPKAIFQSDKEKQKEFLRGYFDTTGHVRTSNAQFGREDQQRIYLEVDHRNWFLVLDLCKLLKKLGVPVESVDFGHPNFRDPDFKKKPGFWAKEHQIKIFANQFLKIGSYLQHKQDVLIELASLNRSGLGNLEDEKKYHIKTKKINPEESSEKLPVFLRTKHFDHYSELLTFLESNDQIKVYE